MSAPPRSIMLITSTTYLKILQDEHFLGYLYGCPAAIGLVENHANSACSIYGRFK
jgi:hypothetical protein